MCWPDCANAHAGLNIIVRIQQKQAISRKANNICALTQGNLILLHANNKGADQPVHPRILVSALVVHYLEIIVVKLALCKISIF